MNIWLLAQDSVTTHAAEAATTTSGSASFAIDLVVILLSAAVLVMALGRVKLAAIPAYLLTGALIGPYALGLVRSAESVESVGGLATILLMFIIGLELDVSSLRGGLMRIGTLGILSTAVATLAMWPLLAVSLSWPAALAVSLALVNSSTAVILRLLQDKRQLHSIHGRAIFGTLVMQDMFALIALACIPLLAAWGGVTPDAGAGDGAHGGALLPADWPKWGKFLLAVGGLVTLVVSCRFALPILLREASRHPSKEVPLVLSAAVALGAALLAAGLGFSPELGAFLAGFLLSGTPFKHQLSGQLSPLRDLFMAVFFVAVGLRLDLRAALDGWVLVLVGIGAVMLLKVAAMGLSAWLLGATASIAAIFAIALFQAGEFSVVILSTVRDNGLITSSELSQLIVVIVVTLTITPTCYTLAEWAQRKLLGVPAPNWIGARVMADHPDQKAVEQGACTPATCQSHVIIAGFGVVGRSISDRLHIQGVPVCVVDLNPATVRRQVSLGRRAVYGDIGNPHVLESAGLQECRAIILTIPDDEATLRACRVIRELCPNAFIAARTSYLSKAMVASQLGADHVTVEEVETAEAMARHVLNEMRRREQRAEAAAAAATAVPTSSGQG